MVVDLWVRGTALFAVLGYAGRVMIDVAGREDQRSQRRARTFWMGGAMALLVHGLCAFHFHHGWSHAAAWEHTRQRALDLTGWNSGFGLWVNYGTTVIWILDAVGWWTSLDWPRRHRVWYWTVQMILGFVMINATVVFGPRYWSVAAMIFVVAIVALRSAKPSRRG